MLFSFRFGKPLASSATTGTTSQQKVPGEVQHTFHVHRESIGIPTQKKTLGVRDPGPLEFHTRPPKMVGFLWVEPSVKRTGRVRRPQRKSRLCMSTSRSARNFGVGLYNSSAGRLGASKLAYSRRADEIGCNWAPFSPISSKGNQKEVDLF